MTTPVEPGFIVQTDTVLTTAERRVWFQERAREARRQGFIWMRHSINPDVDPVLTLVEGWKERPKEQGAIRWQLVKKVLDP